MEEVLSKNVDECLKTPEFEEIPISIVYRIFERSSKPIPSNLLYDYIKESIDSRYIFFIFLNMKELSGQNLSELIETLSKNDDPKWERYSQYMKIDLAYLNEVNKEKNRLQDQIDQLVKENEQLKTMLANKSVPTKTVSTRVNIFNHNKKVINVAVIGQTNSGKSTLVGNLLYKSGFIDNNEFKQIEKEAIDHGKSSLKYAFVSDKLEEERERGFTIKCSSSFIEISEHYYRIIDTPGSLNYIDNLINELSNADITILVVDPTPYQRTQFSLIAFTFGAKFVLVAINEMDDTAINYSKPYFNAIKDQFTKQLTGIGFKEDHLFFVPVSGFNGENLTNKSSKLSWWNNGTLLETLDSIEIPDKADDDKPLRFIVQYVHMQDKDKFIVGTVKHGVMKQGQNIVFSPSNIKANIVSIEMNNAKINEAFPGYYVSIRIDALDYDNETKCGCVCGDPSRDPPKECANFTANLVISNYPKKIYEGYKCFLYCNSTHVPCKFIKFIRRTDRLNGRKIYENPKWILKDDIAVVEIEPLEPISIEVNSDYPSLGRLVFRDMNLVVAVGIALNVEKK